MKRSLPSMEEAVRILRTTHTKRVPKNPPTASRRVQPMIKALEAKFSAADNGLARLKERWPDVVGETLGRISEPVRIVRVSARPGILEIRVASAHATMIQHQTPLLIERLNLFMGAGHIERIRLVQGVVATSSGPKAAPVRLRPLGAREELDLVQSLADIPEGKVKQALLKLGRSVMRQAK